jgi:hypothetical protein
MSPDTQTIAQALGIEEAEPWPFWDYLPYIGLALVIAAFLWFMVKPLFGFKAGSDKIPFALKVLRLARGGLARLWRTLKSFFGSLGRPPVARINISGGELRDKTEDLLGAWSRARKRELRQSLSLFARLIIWGERSCQTTWKPSLGPGEFCALLSAAVIQKSPATPPQDPRNPPPSAVETAAAILRCGEIFEEVLYGPLPPGKETQREFRRLVEEITESREFNEMKPHRRSSPDSALSGDEGPPIILTGKDRENFPDVHAVVVLAVVGFFDKRGVEELAGLKVVGVQLTADDNVPRLLETDGPRRLVRRSVTVKDQGAKAGFGGLVAVPAGIGAYKIQGFAVFFIKKRKGKEIVAVGKIEGPPAGADKHKGHVPAPQYPQAPPARGHGVPIPAAVRPGVSGGNEHPPAADTIKRGTPEITGRQFPPLIPRLTKLFLFHRNLHPSFSTL